MKSLSCNACRSVLALFLLFSSLAASGQKEPSIWIFGDHNGLDFRSGSPVAITNPNVSYHGAELQGVATVTNASGDLLFYAENGIVYNKQHDTMQNGSGMYSVWAASQTGLTIRALHDTTLYYMFTTNMYEINGQSYSKPDLWYSIIDMKANNGLGAVTTKNVPLFNKPTTQLCAIRHCNERDIWVITHEFESDAYYAFLVTPAGVSSTPVISHSGRYVGTSPTFGFSNQHGYMKGSPDGKRIAASWNIMGVDLSDFDNATGRVSNSINLNLMNNFWARANGVEFSPNSRVLYANYFVNSTNSLYQYNVNAGSNAAIIASKTKLEEIYFFGIFGGMQRGPDNKIYVATYGQPYVSIIHNPDVVGTGCNYVLQGLALAGRSSHNFPAYMESKYYPEPPFTFSAGCPPEKVSFDYDKPDNVLSVKWDFDDPSSGSANTSTDVNPVHEFTSSGTYHVKLIRFLVCNTDTLEEEVTITKFSVDLGNDTSVCMNAGYLLQPAAANTFDYLWQDGSTGQTFLAERSGLYWLQITDPVGGCTARDSIILTIQAQPQFTLGPDQQVCQSEVRLETPVSGSSYLWNTGSNDSDILISTSGLYWLQINNGQCFYRDSIEVTFNALAVDLGPDTTICENEIVVLDARNQSLNYTWQDGSTNTSFTVNTPGLYSVVASNGICTATDAVTVNFNKKPVFDLGADKEICGGEVVILGSQLQDIYSYVWEDGSNSPTRKIDRPGTFRLTATNECGSHSDDIIVKAGGCILAVPNAFTPNGDGKNDVFSLSKTALLPSFTMQVFNRWGQKIFESRDQMQGWTGTFGGKLCDAGNYAYSIQYRTNDGTPFTLKGMVLLVR